MCEFSHFEGEFSQFECEFSHFECEFSHFDRNSKIGIPLEIVVKTPEIDRDEKKKRRKRSLSTATKNGDAARHTQNLKTGTNILLQE